MPNKPIAYLGPPYAHPDPEVRNFRVHAVTLMAFELRKQGRLVYSPITHNIPLDRLVFFGDWQTWRDFDHGMLARCDKLLALQLPGCEKSKGLAAEIQFAQEKGIPVEYLEPSPSLIAQAESMRDDASHLATLQEKVDKFYTEQGWQPACTPKNLAMNLHVKAGKLAQRFTWLTEEQSWNLSPQQKQDIADELGGVLLSTAQLSGKLGINLLTAALQSLEKIKEESPVKAEKYSQSGAPS